MIHCLLQTEYVVCKVTHIQILTCVMDLLCDVDAFSVGQSSIYWSSSCRGQSRIECINVKTQVDGTLFPVRGN